MNFAKNRRSKVNSINVVVNSEKWGNYGKRISRKTNDFLNYDSDDDDKRRYEEIKNWVQRFFEGKDTSDKSDQDVEVQLTRKQTLILSTLVPDEVLLMDKFDSSEPKRFVGVLLMADVSGYTSLSEKYNNTGKGGTYRLTVTLNTYLGSLVEVIYSHGGDILKFAGDAFLALWKTDKRSFLSHTIHNVIACALIIQHSYSSYETDVKVNLKVKLAISAGNLLFAPIGRGIDMNYVIFGLPVIEAKAAESVCASGEVKLTPNAWGHCYSRNYDHSIHDDGHVTIKSILYDPHEMNVNKPFMGFGAMIKQVKLVNDIPEAYWDSNKNISAADVAKRNEVLGLRKNILLAEEKNMGGEIRKFMIRPVLTQIDAHQPLEYLTEMRLVSILFMTLKPRQCAFTELITIVNNAYQITCEIVYKSMGCVNKIILFDKDVMMLVVFGLRGFKHESEAQAALKCAYSIKKTISSIDGVLDLSIGVTTGQVYCGVVGHPLRKEFTVIGGVVNKAARLMCKFQNKITCDEATFIKSKLSSNGFTLQPKTELKGIGYPGKIYEYTEDIRIKELYNIPITPPLLGRNDELEYFQNWIEDNCKTTYRDFDALLLVANSGLGKTRLLEWMARATRNKNYHVCYLTLSSTHSASPYLAVSQIVNQLLDLEEPIAGFIKEEKIVQLIQVYNDDLCYLNNIIKVRFAYNDKINFQDEQKRKEKAKLVFSTLVTAVTKTHILFIDDLQNLDSFSWEFISLMFNSTNIFTVMTVTRGQFTSVDDWLYTVFINNHIRKIALEPLSPSLIPALACQILDVDAIPDDLYKALISKCNGIPSLVESFLSHLFCNGALELIKTDNDEVNQWEKEDLIYPNKKLLTPQALDIKNEQKLNELLQADLEDNFTICIVTRKDELDVDIDMQNLDALVMIQIDSLTPYQQLLLKIASVIGNTLSRDLLENIMYENNWLTTAKAVKRLFAMRIFACANALFTKKYSRGSSNTEPTTSYQNEMDLSCDCCFEYDAENSENLPKYAFCKVMKFKNKNTRKTCYELLPINQKKEFHSRIVKYLENNPQKCPYCGGSIMIVQSPISLVPAKRISHDELFNHSDNYSSDSSEETDDSNQETNNNIRDTLLSYDSQNLRPYESQNLRISEKSDDIMNVPTSISDSVINTNKRKSIFDILKIPNVSILKTRKVDTESVGRQSMNKTKRVTITSMGSIKSSTDKVNNNNVFDKLRDVLEAANLYDWHKLGVVDSLDNVDLNKPLFALPIEKNVSQIDITKCTCTNLHVVIYEQLIHHAIQAELKTKAIEFIITYSYLNVLGNNFDVIFSKIDEAESLCSKLSEIDNKKQYLGKIYSLRAVSYLTTGKLTAARVELDRALKIYKINLDKVSDMLKFSRIITYFKMKGRKYRDYALKMKSDSVFCLNVATLVKSAIGEDKRARMAAIRALQIIQEVECPLVDILDAYSNAIQVEISRGSADSTVEIEKMAHQSFKRLTSPVKADELYAVGKFIMECFRASIARAKLPCAIRSGYKVLTISRYLQADKIALELIPDLFYILLSRRRIEEAIDVLNLTLQFDHHSVHEADTWYFAMCIDLILDAGFQKEKPSEISHYAEFSVNITGPARRRLVAGLWTYWLRVNSEKKSKVFETEALNLISSENDGSLSSLLTSMRVAEGMLESLARKVEDLKKVVDLMELRSIADKELIKLEVATRFMRTLYPRWIRLRGNTLKLSGRTVAATTSFNQALEESRRINNRLEESLSRAALSNPVFWLQSARRNNFIDWRPGIEHVHASWHQIMYKMSTSNNR